MRGIDRIHRIDRILWSDQPVRVAIKNKGTGKI